MITTSQSYLEPERQAEDVALGMLKTPVVPSREKMHNRLCSQKAGLGMVTFALYVWPEPAPTPPSDPYPKPVSVSLQNPSL